MASGESAMAWNGSTGETLMPALHEALTIAFEDAQIKIRAFLKDEI